MKSAEGRTEVKHVYHRRGGRPPLDVDFKAGFDAVQRAWNGNGECHSRQVRRSLGVDS